MSELERQHALDRLHIVDTLPETVYDDLACVAARVCETPIALLSLIDRERQWFKARVGLGDHETPRSVAVCEQAIRKPGQLMEVRDLAHDLRFASFPGVAGELHARFYAGMPLVTSEGHAIGTLCVVDRQPRALTRTQRASLASLARIAMALLEGHARKHQEEVAKALKADAGAQRSRKLTAPEPEKPKAPIYRVVILEVQRFATAVERMGERTVEKLLQSLDETFDACLRHELGDRINRVTSSPEFVAVVTDDDGEARVDALRRAAAAESGRGGLVVLVGSAVAASPEEPMETVFLRADEDLSRQKDLAPRSG